MAFIDKLRAFMRMRTLNEPPNGFPSTTAFARLMQHSGDSIRSTIMLSDDDLERFDPVVSQFRDRKPEHYTVLVYCMGMGMKDHEIAEWSHKLEGFQGKRRSRSWVREKRLSGEHWLEAKLDTV